MKEIVNDYKSIHIVMRFEEPYFIPPLPFLYDNRSLCAYQTGDNVTKV